MTLPMCGFFIHVLKDSSCCCSGLVSSAPGGGATVSGLSASPAEPLPFEEPSKPSVLPKIRTPRSANGSLANANALGSIPRTPRFSTCSITPGGRTGPYNIEKKNENEYRISMAIAGFGNEDIELTQNGPELTVIGQRAPEENEREFLHKGLGVRNFKHTFKLADHVKVVSASLENGLLSIDLAREIPEELKPRRIEIAQGARGNPATSHIDQDNGWARKKTA